MNTFSLSSPEFNSMRYQVYAELRKKEPVYWYAPMNTWLVTKHEDITSLLKSDLVATDYLIKDKLNNLKNDTCQSAP